MDWNAESAFLFYFQTFRNERLFFYLKRKENHNIMEKILKPGFSDLRDEVPINA